MVKCVHVCLVECVHVCMVKCVHVCMMKCVHVCMVKCVHGEKFIHYLCNCSYFVSRVCVCVCVHFRGCLLEGKGHNLTICVVGYACRLYE